MNPWSKELGYTFDFVLVWPLYQKCNMVNADRRSRQRQASRDYKRIFQLSHLHGRLSHADLSTWAEKRWVARLLYSCVPLYFPGLHWCQVEWEGEKEVGNL